MRILKLLLLCSFVLLLTKKALASPLINIEPTTNTPTKQEQKETPSTKEMEEKEWKPSEPMHETSHEVHQATESYETAFIKTIVILVSLLLLVILTVWIFRKISYGRIRGMNVAKSIKILEKRALSPKSMLYLIEIGGKQVLIAESQLKVSNIATLDWLGSDKDL